MLRSEFGAATLDHSGFTAAFLDAVIQPVIARRELTEVTTAR